MTREGLMVELRNALNQAKRTNTVVRREGLRIKYDRSHILFHFAIIPFTGSPARDRRFLITFEQPPATEPPPAEPAPRPKGQRGKKKQIPEDTALEKENAQLSQDLAATREYLQSIIEEQEAANEELRSANEEIQSSNEELQSTNEELETAKEELQSTNEELNTVNEELQNRNSQLAQAHNDLLNLLGNVNIPIVMLGNDLRIRRFTPISEKVLNLIPADVGRPISDIKFNIDIPNLREVLLEVIDNLSAQAMEVRDWNGRRYSLRVRPYRTEDNKIDGVVMVLVDLDSGRVYEDLAADATQHDMEPEALRMFTRRLISAQEDERRRISRELHDDLNQKLALLEVNVDMLKQCLPPEDGRARDAIGLFRNHVSELSEDLRRIAYNLHPAVLEDLGLVAALQSYIAEVTRRDGLEIKFRHQDVPAGLTRESAITLFRIVQEAIRNVVKHSGANRATVTVLGLGSKIRVCIRENGNGFDFNDRRGKGLGIISMEERARLLGGTLAIKTSPGSGTVVDVEIPVPGEAT
jgi:signal transduction histidine kinase